VSRRHSLQRGAGRWLAIAIAVGPFAGCAFTAPYVGQGPHPQISRGQPIPVLDTTGNILAAPFKLLLWNKHFACHHISAETEAAFIKFLDARTEPAFEDTKFRLNEYTPIKDLKALVTNRYMAWPYRLVLGLPTTLLSDVLLPGRLLPLGDYYNPFTNTAHLYSDDPAILMHEAGHAYDFATFPHRGTYALLRFVPFVDLYQEWRASDEAMRYILESEDRDAEYHAYRTLWPAFGTYVGAYAPIPFGSYAGALLGHPIAWVKVSARRRYYDRMDRVLMAPDLPQSAPAPAPTPHAVPVPAH